jgi:hypothetical protein
MHDTEVFFKVSSISGDEMLYQLIHVITSYEFIGCKIYGICSDAAGGNNAQLFKILQAGKNLKGCWLENEYAMIKNPVDPRHLIAFFHCSTHNLKALCNALPLAHFLLALHDFSM